VAALVATVTHNVKAIHLRSLLTSVGTLIVGRRLICSSSLIATAEAKLIALSLVSFLPQFVMFGLYVSNDSLAIYLGFLLIHKFRRLIYRPSFSSALLVIAIASLGLLTKGQFVGIVPLTFLFGLLLIWKRRIEIEHRGALLVLAALLGGSGLAKYVQNTLVYGSPFLSNLDFNPEWLAAQQGTYLGLAAALDINFLKLIFEPTVAESTKHSVSLLLFGSFWYQYIPESNFTGNLVASLRFIGGWMYVHGAAFFLLVAFGLLRLFLCSFSKKEQPNFWFRFFVVSLLASNVLIILYTFGKFDAWSILQARSLFPSFLGITVLLGFGLENVPPKFRRDSARFWLHGFLVGCAIYFGSEVALQVHHFVS